MRERNCIFTNKRSGFRVRIHILKDLQLNNICLFMSFYQLSGLCRGIKLCAIVGSCMSNMNMHIKVAHELLHQKKRHHSHLKNIIYRSIKMQMLCECCGMRKKG